MSGKLFIWKRDGVEERGLFAGLFDGQNHYVTVVGERSIVLRGGDEITELREAAVVDLWDSNARRKIESIDPGFLSVLSNCGCSVGNGVRVTCAVHQRPVEGGLLVGGRSCNCGSRDEIHADDCAIHR